jgi:hypothetical protein
MDVVDVEWRELSIAADAGFVTAVANAVPGLIAPDLAFVPLVTNATSGPIEPISTRVESAASPPRKPTHWLPAALWRILRWPIEPRRWSWPWERPALLSNPPTQAGKTSALQHQTFPLGALAAKSYTLRVDTKR